MQEQALIREAYDRVVRVRHRLATPHPASLTSSLEDLGRATESVAGLERRLAALPPPAGSREEIRGSLEALAQEIRGTQTLLAAAQDWLTARQQVQPDQETSYGPAGDPSPDAPAGGSIYG